MRCPEQATAEVDRPALEQPGRNRSEELAEDRMSLSESLLRIGESRKIVLGGPTVTVSPSGKCA